MNEKFIEITITVNNNWRKKNVQYARTLVLFFLMEKGVIYTANDTKGLPIKVSKKSKKCKWKMPFYTGWRTIEQNLARPFEPPGISKKLPVKTFF